MAYVQAFPHFRVRHRYLKATYQEKITRLGTDLVWIPEIEQSVVQFGDRYLQRMFSLQELQDCRQGQQLNYQKLAARVAAKEATMKILGLNKDTALPWNSIEVTRNANGLPGLRLHREAQALARTARLGECILSLSHEHEYAIATVIANVNVRVMDKTHRNTRSSSNEVTIIHVDQR
ncbi:holo-ACP synthase [Undibacterium sp. RuRC25W]|uniref:holo-ACP synthase n=1 Tax=Undibacterium sp. RuRC25W TaxID=3413047 RepID=UPI003BF26AFA